MPAKHFNSVDFPDPLRPTIPKNSPGGTEKDTPRNARNTSVGLRRNGCNARSLSVLTCSRGISKRLCTRSTTTGGGMWSGICLKGIRHAAYQLPARCTAARNSAWAWRPQRLLERSERLGDPPADGVLDGGQPPLGLCVGFDGSIGAIALGFKVCEQRDVTRLLDGQ
jgi:hypothetical protein